jgi:transposase-like protein
MTIDPSIHDVRRQLDARLTETPDKCPICSQKIGGSVSLDPDWECAGCKLRGYTREDGRDVDYRTIPTYRIKQSIRRTVYTQAAYESLSSDDGEEASGEEGTDA